MEAEAPQTTVYPAGGAAAATWRRRAGGHWHTVAPVLRHRTVPRKAPPSESWRHALEVPGVGEVELTGRLHRADTGDGKDLLILVHGLGGCAESHYMVPSVRAALRAGVSALRLNLRGADRRPSDFYHAGLSTDLAEILRSPALDAFERIDVMGFSLGGHVSLKFATEVEDERVGAVAAICSPVDLASTVRDFDALPPYPYKEYILANIRRMFVQVMAGRDLPGDLDAERVKRTRTLREFDSATVVERFGFDDADHYYRSQSVADRLHRLRRPALLVAAEHDPMISARSIREGLARVESGGGESALDGLQVAWSRAGGHVGFPPDLDLSGELGLPRSTPSGIYDQVVAWLGRIDRD